MIPRAEGVPRPAESKILAFRQIRSQVGAFHTGYKGTRDVEHFVPTEKMRDFSGKLGRLIFKGESPGTFETEKERVQDPIGARPQFPIGGHDGHQVQVLETKAAEVGALVELALFQDRKAFLQILVSALLQTDCDEICA